MIARMKHLLASGLCGLFLAGLLVGAVSSRASAVDLSLEILFDPALQEETTVMVSQYPHPEFLSFQRIGPGTASMMISLSHLIPGRHALYFSTTDVKRFEFVIDEQGVVTFDPSPNIQQNGNQITYTPG